MKEDSDEREYEAEDNKSLENEKDKSLDVGVYLEEFVDQGKTDRQESEALVEDDGEVGKAALVGPVDDDQDEVEQHDKGDGEYKEAEGLSDAKREEDCQDEEPY